MSACPNISSPEWQALEAAVGRTEAFRDWMETNGEIRTPEVVQKKLNRLAGPANSRAAIRPVAVKTDKLSIFKKEVKFANKVSNLRLAMILKRVKSANTRLTKQLGVEVKFGINSKQVGKMDLFELEIVDYKPESVPRTDTGTQTEIAFMKDFPAKPISDLEKELVDGFLKDFNINVSEYESMKDELGIDAYSASDLIAKAIAYQKGESILPEVAYFAFKMLGDKNNKIMGNLRYLVNSWDKYQERFDYHKQKILSQKGFIKNKTEWKNKVRDLVIVDFLQETLVKYYNNPKEFKKELETKWVYDRTLWEKFLRFLKDIEKLLTTYAASKKDQKEQLQNIGFGIVDEILSRNYEYYDYALAENQIKKQYNDTINSSKFAKTLVEKGQEMGLILTGSLALRKSGEVYRTADESLHDIDWIVPYDRIANEKNQKVTDSIKSEQKGGSTVMAAKDVESYDWFKKLKKDYPSLTIYNAFYGSKTDFRTLTVLAVINGEYYDSDGYHEKEYSYYKKDPETGAPIKAVGKARVLHAKGSYKAGTGTMIDFFVRLEPRQEEHVNYFLLWKEIFKAKLSMAKMRGREKDWVDWKAFVPYTKSQDSYNFTYEGFRHFNYERDENNALEDRAEAVNFSDDVAHAEADPFQSTLLPGNTIELDDVSTDDARGYEIAQKLADAFSLQLGVEYQIINSEQAKAIFGDRWNGEPALFHGGIVYFMGDRFNTSRVLHEFGHPLIRGIQKDNPKLFNSLYQKAISTKEGKDLIEKIKKYYKLSEKDPIFQEELLVRILAEALALQQSNTPVTAGFAKVIKDILYALKQILRKVFNLKTSKTSKPSTKKIEELEVGTTLNDLASMLMAGGKFEISTESINQEDVIAFEKEFNEENETLEDLAKQDPGGFKTATDKFLSMVSKQLKLLEKNEEFEILGDIFNVKLKEEAPLGNIKSSLSQYRSEILRKVEQAGTNINYTRQHVDAFINSLNQLEVLVEKMNTHLEELSKNPDNKDNLMKINNYDQMINWWSGFIDEVNEFMLKQNVPAGNSLRKKVSTIKTYVDDIKKTANEIRLPGMRDFLYEQLESMNKNIEDYYSTLIKDLKERGANERTIEYYEKEFEDTRLSPAKIEQFLKGNLGDAYGLNVFMEGYMYSQDPVVASFAKFVKDNTTEYLSNAYQKYNEFIEGTNSTLEAAGFNAINVAGFGRELVFEDTISVMEDGKLVKKGVFTFLNDHQNWREATRNMEYEITEAKNKADESGSAEDLQAYYNLEQARDKHMRTYFHQYYRDEFYKAAEVFDDVIGQQAFAEWKRVTGELAAYSRKRFDQDDEVEMNSINEALLTEYRLLFSLTDLEGNKKVDTENDKAYTKALKLRQYRKDTAEFFEQVPKEGMFQEAYLNYEKQIVESGVPRVTTIDGETVANPTFVDSMNSWVKRNTVKKVKPEYYDILKEKYAELEKLTAKLKESQGGKDLIENLAIIHDAAALYRDEDGEPDASDMQETLIERTKRAQEAVNDFRDSFAGFSGLTKEEMGEITDYYETRQMALEGYTSWPTDAEKNRVKVLLSKKKTLGLDPISKARVLVLLSELRELQSKEPTIYYLDVFNNYLSMVNTDSLHKDVASRIATKENMELILNGETSEGRKSIIHGLLKQNPKFKAWFDKNHITREYWHKPSKSMKTKWERVSVWSVSRPKDLKYMEETLIQDSTGEDVLIFGLPSRQYFQRSVKPGLISEQIVGKTIDNKGRYLPKLADELAPGVDHRYINQRYQELKAAYKADPQSKKGKLFSALELLKKYHLGYQEGLTNPKKLYMDIPRYRADDLEIVQSRKVGRNPFRVWIDGFKDRWRKAKDDLEFGYNADKYADAEFAAVKTDMFNNELSDIPISGIANLELEQTSLDITHGMMRYMMGTEKQKQLMKIQPVAKGLQSLLNDPRYQNNELNDMTKKNFLNLGQRTYVNKKGKTVRAAAIDAMIERDFGGQQMAGVTKDLKWLNALSGVLFGRASFGFFALNFPSAIKNQFGAMFQGAIEAAAGTHMNPLSYGKGVKDSVEVMGAVTTELYKGKTKSLGIQTMDIFDMVHGRLEEKFGEVQSRTLAKDVVQGLPNFTWLYNFRKWTETQATLSLSFGMMNHKKITQVVDGVEKQISYKDAWEIKDGKIKLKDGIDKTWDINGRGFKDFKNLMHQINERAQGAYAKLAQPEAQRFLLYRMVSFLRKYFTTMLMERWGFRGKFWKPKMRYDIGTNNLTQGFYITTMQSLIRWMSTGGKALPIMTPLERRAFIKLGTEIASVVLLGIMYSWLFDFDPDDEEKYEKLRQKSGPLPFPFVGEDSEHPFHPGGWMSNQMLQVMMQVRAENDQWLPFPGFGMDNYAQQLALKSFAYGPTIESYVKILSDLYMMGTGDDRSDYMRDIGPYDWQKADSEKIWNHAFKMFGITGSTMDPVLAIKNFQSWQQTTSFR